MEKKWTNTAVPEDHEDLCWKSEDCVGVVFSRDLVWVCAYSYFRWRPWRPFYILNIIDKRKNKKEHFCSSESSGETREYTTSNLIMTEGLLTWSSEVFRKISKSCRKMKKLQKPKTLRVLCVVFRSLKKTRKSVCTLFTTVCNFFSCTPSHTQLTNHHTTIIQSYHFQTIIP